MTKRYVCKACSVGMETRFHTDEPCPKALPVEYEYAAAAPVAAVAPVAAPVAAPASVGALEQVIIDAIGPHLTTLIKWDDVYTKAAEIARAEAANVAPIRVEIVRKDMPDIDMGLQHAAFPMLVRMLSAGLNVWLVGPAGTGKTVAAEFACEALGYEYFRAKSVGPTTAEYDLIGYNNAGGTFVHGAFYQAFKFGGVLLIDEIDSASGDALIAINGALANGFAFFGDERVEKHADFRCIAAANTVGQGRDSVYIGRAQLDGATLDRFDFLPWGYDSGIEAGLVAAWKGVADNASSRETIDTWYSMVKQVRGITERLDIRIPISTRAIIDGCKFIALAGGTVDECAEMRFWARMSTTDTNKVRENMKV